jgi:hypothetical protein
MIIRLSEYNRNKDEKKIKRIPNDIYETEEYENKILQQIENKINNNR